MKTRKKTCFGCKEQKDVLYRCKYQEMVWSFLCEDCLVDVKHGIRTLINTAERGRLSKSNSVRAFAQLVFELEPSYPILPISDQLCPPADVFSGSVPSERRNHPYSVKCEG